MIAVKDMEMPSCCEVCDFRKSDLYSGEVYCSKAAGDNIILYEDEKLDNCPLVEIEERKVGKWIRVDHTKVKCSNCDITHLIAQYPHGVIDYCPNCGSYNQSIIENER